MRRDYGHNIRLNKNLKTLSIQKFWCFYSPITSSNSTSLPITWKLVKAHNSFRSKELKYVDTDRSWVKQASGRMKNTRRDHSSLCKQGDMVASTMKPKSEKSPLTQTTLVKILTSELVALPGARTKKRWQNWYCYWRHIPFMSLVMTPQSLAERNITKPKCIVRPSRVCPQPTIDCNSEWIWRMLNA